MVTDVSDWTLADVRDFAAKAHADEGQVREYTGEPYIVHPISVAGLVATVPGVTKEMIAAAILHDVPDDTRERHETIAERFGSTVGRYVRQLSNVTRPGDGPRAWRMEKERAHSAAADPEVKTIKIGDIISNTISIVTLNREFARIYLPEKRLQLDVLREGDQGLFLMASNIIERGLAELSI